MSYAKLKDYYAKIKNENVNIHKGWCYCSVGFAYI